MGLSAVASRSSPWSSTSFAPATSAGSLDAIVAPCYRSTPSVRSLLLILTLSLLSARAAAEGSTLSSVKVGACALLTAADAQRVSNVPMQVQAGAPGIDSPGRTCAYRAARPGPFRGTVQIRLLDAREWSQIKAEASPGKPEIDAIKGIGDEAYFVRTRRARRPGALVLFVRRGGWQFSVRFAGAGPELTDPMKQLARSVAGRL